MDNIQNPLTGELHPVRRKFYWKIRINQLEAKSVEIDTRPILNVEEKEEIDFLGNKMWVPGKPTWEKIHIELQRESFCLIEQINKSNQISLIMSDINDNIIEIWTLKNVKLTNVFIKDETAIATLLYDDVRYETNKEVANV